MSLLPALVAMTHVLRGVFSPTINGFPLLVSLSTMAELTFAMEGKSVIHRSSLVIRQVVLDVLLDLGIPI